jgi:DNA-nicking Smr family endonuclease
MAGRRRHNSTPRGGSLGDPLLDRRPVAVLDLHRYSVPEADQAVLNFIHTWQRRAPGSVVHIVTGKGRRSPGAPALKPRVLSLLKNRLSAFTRDCSRDVDDGGFLVLLR